jgi:hypothetical protein
MPPQYGLMRIRLRQGVRERREIALGFEGSAAASEFLHTRVGPKSDASGVRAQRHPIRLQIDSNLSQPDTHQRPRPRTP